MSPPAHDGTLLSGQPIGEVVQCAYTVAGIDRGMAASAATLGAGPRFLLGPFPSPEGRDRGAPTQMRIRLAVAYVGNTMIELIAQHDDEPSAYREMIEKTGYGSHHWAVTSLDFDEDVAAGRPVVFSGRSPRGERGVYVDATPALPGLLEIVELIRPLREF